MTQSILSYEAAAQVRGTTRPSSSLLLYRCLTSLIVGPFFLLLLIPAWLRYRSLAYRFEDRRVHMSWGRLFRREINLGYDRIQDVTVTSNVLERYLGLAKVHVQTASGSAGAEMVIEGLENWENVRSFLYDRMRDADEPADEEVRLRSEDVRALVAVLAQLNARLSERGL